MFSTSDKRRIKEAISSGTRVRTAVRWATEVNAEYSEYAAMGAAEGLTAEQVWDRGRTGTTQYLNESRDENK